MAREDSLSIVILTSIFSIGGGLYVYFTSENILGAFLIIGFGVLEFIGLVIYFIYKRKDRRLIRDFESRIELESNLPPEERIRRNEQHTLRAEQALSLAKEEKKAQRKKDSPIIKEYKKKLQDDDFCMICKLDLREENEILQCPFCRSLFHKEHLEEWLTIKKTCPVCSQKFDKKQDKK